MCELRVISHKEAWRERLNWRLKVHKFDQLIVSET